MESLKVLRGTIEINIQIQTFKVNVCCASKVRVLLLCCYCEKLQYISVEPQQ